MVRLYVINTLPRFNPVPARCPFRGLQHSVHQLSTHSKKENPEEQPEKSKDEDSTVVDHQEHCKLGFDDDVEQMDGLAFGKDKTRPDELHAEAERQKVHLVVL